MNLFTNIFSLLITVSLVVSCKQNEKVKIEIKTDPVKSHISSPEWFSDAKLGIYFTWGVYSVPAFNNEWYPWHMYRTEDHAVKKHHSDTYGNPKDFNYHDFVPMFTAKQFNATDWAKLFKDAGAKFAGPCAQHHDGFAMWASKVNPWNVADRGPKQDITGKLEKAIKGEGLKFITTFHHARNLQRYADNPEKWESFESHFAYNPDFATSSTDPDTAKLYGNIPAEEFHQYWFEQLKEVIDQYSPDIIWFDSWLNLIPVEYRKDFIAYYLTEAHKKNQKVVIAHKQNDIPKNIGVLDIEQGGKKDLSESVWLTDVTLSTKSWSYIKGQEYKPADLIVRNMIDVWSKNGVVLLNCSPTAEGVIPKEQRDILHKIGKWMKKHEEAVYETRPFDFYGFGNTKASDGHFGGQSATVEYTANDGRFLKSKDGKCLFLFLLGKPKVGTKLQIRGLAKHDFFPAQGIKRITVMGDKVEANWHFGMRNFILTIPNAQMDEIATVFKMELN